LQRWRRQNNHDYPSQWIEELTRAANVNSRSSERNVWSSIAISSTSSRRLGLRKRYSVTPNQRRKSLQRSTC
jgi:hypothetical protein